jgi:hypothetical protein
LGVIHAGHFQIRSANSRLPQDRTPVECDTKAAVFCLRSNPMSWNEAFKSRSDLEKYGSNSIGLFAMALRFTLEDLDTVASESIVDGPDDKKCDIVYVDTEERYAVIAQCYLSPVATKPAAKSDKAADLNTAIAWLLDADMQSIPAGLQPSAMALRTVYP